MSGIGFVAANNTGSADIEFRHSERLPRQEEVRRGGTVLSGSHESHEQTFAEGMSPMTSHGGASADYDSSTMASLTTRYRHSLP